MTARLIITVTYEGEPNKSEVLDALHNAANYAASNGLLSPSDCQVETWESHAEEVRDTP